MGGSEGGGSRSANCDRSGSLTACGHVVTLRSGPSVYGIIPHIRILLRHSCDRRTRKYNLEGQEKFGDMVEGQDNFGEMVEGQDSRDG